MGQFVLFVCPRLVQSLDGLTWAAPRYTHHKNMPVQPTFRGSYFHGTTLLSLLETRFPHITPVSWISKLSYMLFTQHNVLSTFLQLPETKATAPFVSIYVNEFDWAQRKKKRKKTFVTCNIRCAMTFIS